MSDSQDGSSTAYVRPVGFSRSFCGSFLQDSDCEIPTPMSRVVGGIKQKVKKVVRRVKNVFKKVVGSVE